MTSILIVDDSPLITRMLRFMLSHEGYDVLVANNGYEALAYLEKNPVDLMIIDLAMPRMDGLTLLRSVRNDCRYKALPVIMLTASGFDEDKIVAMREGANVFLTKPAGSFELIATIRQLLEHVDTSRVM